MNDDENPASGRVSEGKQYFESRVCLPCGRLSPPLLTPAPGQAPQALPPSPAGGPAVHLTISVKRSPLWEGSTGYKKQK